MRASRLTGAAAGAALAFSACLSAAAAQTATPPGAAAAGETAGAVDSRVPVPDFIELNPITPTDLRGSDAPATTASTAPAAVPALPERSVATAPAAATPPSEPDFRSAVPLPEPAGVAPPTVKDIGTPPLHPIDLAIAERIKELVSASGRGDRNADARKQRVAVEEFYQARRYAPLWLDLGAPSERMKGAVARLKAADTDGLDAGDYPVPDLKALGQDSEALAQAELRLTNSVLAYARHAQAGRVTPARISPNIDFTPQAPDPADVLKQITESGDAAKALGAFNPPHEGFLALKRKLAELRGGAVQEDVVHIPPGPALRPGATDKRVPLLRQRFGLPEGEDNRYDETLADLVKAFQKEKGVKADGTVGGRTLELMNGGRSKNRDLASVISNMERWRWLPRDLGRAYVMVNVPDFTLKVVNNGKTAFHTRIVVGKPNTPSPSFSAQIENILVNPTWHVPQSIIYGEYLPAMKDDPSVLARMGLVMERNRDGTISIRQPPGERNALGRIKFNFSNKYQVYLHDTPDKKLFANDRRAYSHGCMRVQNPTQFGEVLASIALPEQNLTAAKFQSMFGSNEQWFNFKRKIPVHLVYLNAYVDEHDKLVVRDDLYGYDGRVQSALRGDYMAIAERSQKVTPGAYPAASAGSRRSRQVVQDVPRQQGGFFGFPWFR